MGTRSVERPVPAVASRVSSFAARRFPRRTHLGRSKPRTYSRRPPRQRTDPTRLKKVMSHCKAFGASVAVPLSRCRTALRSADRSPRLWSWKTKRHLDAGEDAAAIIELKDALRKGARPCRGRDCPAGGRRCSVGPEFARGGKELNRARSFARGPTDRSRPPLARTMVYLGESRKLIDQVRRIGSWES